MNKYTILGEHAYVGISKLCSAKMPGTTEKTQGIGYYGSSEKNQPVMSELMLDKLDRIIQSNKTAD